MTKNQRSFFQIALGLAGLFIASFWKMQVAFGSKTLFFSASNIVGPLLGLGAGPLVILTTFLLRRAIAWGFLGGPLLSVFSTYIPTMCAASYWSNPSKAIRLFLPLLCMILFILHPVGAQAWVYALYWLIPVVIYFVPYKSVFVHALASTFIQHAVGSVIWLYLAPSTPALWLSLLPVVIVERLVFASGMVVVIKTAQALQSFLVSKFSSYRSYTSIFG